MRTSPEGTENARGEAGEGEHSQPPVPVTSHVDMDRVVARELHSARTAAVLTLATVASALSLFLVLEALLQLSGQEPLLLAPQRLKDLNHGLPSQAPATGLSFGLLFLIPLALLLVGVWFLALAVLPGRRARFVLAGSSILRTVVDADVLAATIAAGLRRQLRVKADGLTVRVSLSRVTVHLSVSRRSQVTSDSLAAATQEILGSIAPEPLPRVRVHLQTEGRRE